RKMQRVDSQHRRGGDRVGAKIVRPRAREVVAQPYEGSPQQPRQSSERDEAPVILELLDRRLHRMPDAPRDLADGARGGVLEQPKNDARLALIHALDGEGGDARLVFVEV